MPKIPHCDRSGKMRGCFKDHVLDLKTVVQRTERKRGERAGNIRFKGRRGGENT